MSVGEPPPATAAILDELEWRGLIEHATDVDALRAELAGGPITFYCGFDPTAQSLHFGNLVQLVTMRRLQQAGHRPIAVVGGATGLIGDPSGKSAERMLNPVEVVEAWVERIRGQVERFLEFGGDNPARIVNNLEWTAPMSAIALLRDVGKHFGVSRMLAKEAVSARMEAGGISYTEFSYQILQALDYLELYRRYGCRLQTGGSDQWGNLTAGVDLIRRVENASVHALATPLVTRTEGGKFGKTEAGAVWLDPELMSPYAFYQYFLNTEDADVIALLKVFSFRTREQIAELRRATEEQPQERAAQRALAEELAALVHGEEQARRVVAASEALFGSGDLRSLDVEALAAAVSELSPVAVSRPVPPLVDLLVVAGLSPSRGAARRTISEGGIYLNNAKVADGSVSPSDADLLHGRWLILRRGRRSLAAVEVPQRG